MSYRYNNTAHEFDEQLSGFLTELEGERVIKEAVEKEPDDSLQRIVTGKTPLEEVRAIIESKTKKSAAEEIEEHGVRLELRKVATRSREAVDSFLAMKAAGSWGPEWAGVRTGKDADKLIEKRERFAHMTPEERMANAKYRKKFKALGTEVEVGLGQKD